MFLIPRSWFKWHSDMAEEPAAEIQILRSHKAKLIEILSNDSDFVLQHADSRSLLSRDGYDRVKSCRIPTEKVTELLDHVLQRGPEPARGLLELLKDQALQETFPLLDFIKHLPFSTLASGGSTSARHFQQSVRYCQISIWNINVSCVNTRRNKKEKKKEEKSSWIARDHSWQTDLQQQWVTLYSKLSSAKHWKIITCFICLSHFTGSCLVTEKQLMTVACGVGKGWQKIGRLALDVSSVKLEQIEEDHSTHVERVFAMLRYWRMCQREKATAANLHSLLSQGDWALPPETIDHLLKSDWGLSLPGLKHFQRTMLQVDMSLFSLERLFIHIRKKKNSWPFLMGPVQKQWHATEQEVSCSRQIVCFLLQFRKKISSLKFHQKGCFYFLLWWSVIWFLYSPSSQGN